MMLDWIRSGDHPIDTHILVHHSRARPQWLDQCVAALDQAPTNILLVDDRSTNVGALRAAAMARGKAPFLCFVDDDDYAIASAFDECLRVLEADRSLVGVYTDFHGVTPEGVLRTTTRKAPWCPQAHLLNLVGEVLHLHVYRRSAAMPYLDGLARWPTLEEGWLCGQMVQRGAWRKLDIVGYNKRDQPNGAGARITPALLKRAVAECAPGLLAARCPLHDHSGSSKSAPPRPTALQRWVRTDTGCSTCNKVRAAVGRIAGA